MKQPIRIIEDKGSGFIIENLKTKAKAYIPKNLLSTKIRKGYYHLVKSAFF
jgi:hypothetical protein